MTEQEATLLNQSLVETDIHCIGDRTIIGQVVELLAYIRNGIANNMKTTISVNIDQTVANVPFTFQVNQMQVPDLVLKNDVHIN